MITLPIFSPILSSILPVTPALRPLPPFPLPSLSSIHPSIHPSNHPSAYTPVFPSFLLHFHLSLNFPSLCLSFLPSLWPSFWPFFFWSIQVSRLSVHISALPSACPLCSASLVFTHSLGFISFTGLFISLLTQWLLCSHSLMVNLWMVVLGQPLIQPRWAWGASPSLGVGSVPP